MVTNWEDLCDVNGQSINGWNNIRRKEKDDWGVVACGNCSKECCHECQYKWMLMVGNICEYCNMMYCNECIDIENHNCGHDGAT